MFAGAEGQRLRRDWLRSIHARSRHIVRHLSRHSSANNHLMPGAFDFCGSHDGYLRLSDSVRHRRSVRFDAAGATLLVRDELSARKAHRLEQFWHFAPGLALELDGVGRRVRGRAFSLQLQVSGAQLQLALLRGADDPPLGWCSPAYEAKQPCHVLKITTLACGLAVECRLTIMFFVASDAGREQHG